MDILLPHGSAQPRAHEQGAEGSVSWQGLPGKPGLEGPQGPVGMYVSAVAAQERHGNQGRGDGSMWDKVNEPEPSKALSPKHHHCFPQTPLLLHSPECLPTSS